MRGLKLGKVLITKQYSVASFTDAWIETAGVKETRYRLEVASFTDAWIETDLTPEQKDELKSHLLQMRGLKQTIHVLPKN